MTISLEEALRRVIDSESDSEIAAAVNKLSDVESRWLNDELEDEYGSDIEDMLQEKGMDQTEWVRVISNAIQAHARFRRT